MLSRLGLGFLLVIAATISCLAQMPAPSPAPFPSYQGTADDQRACQPAVFKFCQSAIPDTFRILQCLQANRAHIGKACQAVLASYGQ